MPVSDYRQQVFAILRFENDASGEHSVTVKEILWDLETADAEVRRLNSLNADKGCRYVWQATRLKPRAFDTPRSTDQQTTTAGYVNRNRQTVLRPTRLPGNDHLQFVYVLRCGDCGAEYGANGSDIFQRRCPKCQGGAPGLAF